MTIASAFNDIAVAQGGTASQSGTIAGAIDALNDALAGSDQESCQTIEGAVRLLGEHIGGGSSVTVEALTATENKTYTAPEGKAFSPVTVNVAGGTTEYNITCLVNDEFAQSVIYPTKASTDNDGKWEKDGNTPIDTAQAGQVLLVPTEYTIEVIAYFSDPMPEHPQEIPYSSLVAKDNDAGVFVMPAHDIGIMVYQVTPQ